MNLFGKKLDLPAPDQALPGRTEEMRVPDRHEVLGTPLTGPWPAGLEVAYFAMGCFWGGEELYWQVPGVHSTAVGYQGGITPNPTYEEACTGRTGHTEAVQVVYDPAVVSYEELLKVFWEHHDSTQGMRQGNDIGTQYLSAVYTTSEAQLKSAQASRDTYQVALTRSGLDAITTEILPAGPFYYAEPYHQQYLHKNPNGYRCHSETGVPYPA
jgi:peptide-methionine (S)-S-oxide reductase